MSEHANEAAALILKQAIAEPTESNVEAARSHPVLKLPLSELSIEDFKKLNAVVAPYLTLAKAFSASSEDELTRIKQESNLRDLLEKFSLHDVKSINAVMLDKRPKKNPCTLTNPDA